VARNENASHIRSRSLPLVALALSCLLLATACGSGSAASSVARGDCPTEPVPVVVTVDQWGDIASSLAGGCAVVTTIIKGSSADPHEYEPTPGDSAAFERARLVVRNGLSYDTWANKAIATLDTKPVIVDGGTVVGRHDGDNPHIWYSPQYVREVSAAITAALQRVSPKAAGYFASRQTAWKASMRPYDEEVARVKAIATGKPYGATEPVFDDMAAAVGMKRATPDGYQHAAANESDPSPGDIADFEHALRNRSMSVLVFNTQTDAPTPSQLRAVARDSHVPVLSVTETVPPGAHGFVTWQVGQLRALAQALEP
jgi:zinc/manganese transport system substrate-binding protein